MGRLKRRNPYKKTQARRQDQVRLENMVKKKIYEDRARELDDITSIYFMSYIALALHRELGFGERRIARVLKAMDELDTELCGSTLEDITNLVKQECKITFIPGGMR
jgi:hypothetical protein